MPETDPALTWYLRSGPDNVYGEFSLKGLVQWAQQGRITADNEISHNGKDWVPAENVPELKMEWMVMLKSGIEHGPLNLLAVPELYQRGQVDKTAILQNRVTGRKLSAAALLRGMGREDGKRQTVITIAETKAPVKADPPAGRDAAKGKDVDVSALEARVGDLKTALNKADEKNGELSQALERLQTEATTSVDAAIEAERITGQKLAAMEAELAGLRTDKEQIEGATTERQRTLEQTAKALQVRVHELESAEQTQAVRVQDDEAMLSVSKQDASALAENLTEREKECDELNGRLDAERKNREDAERRAGSSRRKFEQQIEALERKIAVEALSSGEQQSGRDEDLQVLRAELAAAHEAHETQLRSQAEAFDVNIKRLAKELEQQKLSSERSEDARKKRVLELQGQLDGSQKERDTERRGEAEQHAEALAELQTQLDQAQAETARLMQELRAQQDTAVQQTQDEHVHERKQYQEQTRSAELQIKALQHEIQTLSTSHAAASEELETQLGKEESELQSRLDEVRREAETEVVALKLEQVSSSRAQATELERIRAAAAEQRKRTEVTLRARIKTLEAELAKQREKARREIAELEKQLAQQMKDAGSADQAAEGSEDAEWFLKLDDGATYGPTKLAELIAWAAQCRVGPGQEVSTDQASWKKVEDIAALRMTWRVKLVDGADYGPLNVLAVRHLIAEGAVDPKQDVVHASRGDALSLDDAIEAEVLDLMVSGRTAAREIAERDALLAAAGSRIQELEDELKQVESAKLPPRSIRHFVKQD